MSKYNLIDILEGMSNDEWEAAKEADRLEAHPEADKIKAIQALLAKEKANKDNIKEEDEISTLQKISNDTSKMPAERDAARNKMYALKKEKQNVKEMTGEAYGRIDGLINRRLLNQLFDTFDEIYTDLVQADEMFPVSDLVDYVCQEIQEFSTQGMSAEIDLDESTGPSDKSEPEDDVDNVDTLASPDAKAKDYDSAVSAGSNQNDLEGKEDAQVAPMFEKEDQHGNLFQALANFGSEVEIKQYLDSVDKDMTRTPDQNDYEGWTEDDYIEDFKNYIADKSLQEHFGRFLKDYQ